MLVMQDANIIGLLNIILVNFNSYELAFQMGGTAGDDTVCKNVMFVRNQKCSLMIFQTWRSKYNMQCVYFEYCFAGAKTKIKMFF